MCKTIIKTFLIDLEKLRQMPKIDKCIVVVLKQHLFEKKSCTHYFY